MSTTPEEPTDEQLRAAYEEEIKRLRVEQVVLESIVTVINLGMRRSGLLPGTEDERDVEQVEVAIESVRAQVPVLERIAPDQLPRIRDALSQLQLAFVRAGGQASPAGPAAQAPPTDAEAPAAEPAGEPASPVAGQPQPRESEPIQPGEPGPAQRSGRLWVPGQ
jgi:hypothetical protein